MILWPSPTTHGIVPQEARALVWRSLIERKVEKKELRNTQTPAPMEM